MGKYSNFERKPRDLYPTPLKAVEPLFPHLPDKFTFSEPCAGNGVLIDHITSIGGECVYAGDIVPLRNDIRQLSYEDYIKTQMLHKTPDLVITNPPWTRSILHDMITKLPAIADTWLLFDSDWVHTKQSTLYMENCVKIVSIGRVKWFGGTTGKENASWHLFREGYSGPTEFCGREQ